MGNATLTSSNCIAEIFLLSIEPAAPVEYQYVVPLISCKDVITGIHPVS